MNSRSIPLSIPGESFTGKQTEFSILKWHKRPGERVAKGDVIVDIEMCNPKTLKSA
ncbi:MAG: hypothetical protein FJ086_12245 [Deltaproteobacteria bacterium]|nr:hypothetical protein [Deltaproteobacteria bacterium]